MFIIYPNTFNDDVIIFRRRWLIKKMKNLYFVLLWKIIVLFHCNLTRIVTWHTPWMSIIYCNLTHFVTDTYHGYSPSIVTWHTLLLNLRFSKCLFLLVKSPSKPLWTSYSPDKLRVWFISYTNPKRQLLHLRKLIVLLDPRRSEIYF